MITRVCTYYLFSLNEVKMNVDLTTDSTTIEKYDGDFNPVEKALGLTEDNFLPVAHQFLAKYKTIWDCAQKKSSVSSY